MPTAYVALLRGINVGGRNPVPMRELQACMTELGADDVATYIQSGNVLFTARGRRGAASWATAIEAALADRFGYEARIVLRSHAQLRAVVDAAPRGFGSKPDAYRYDVVFLRGPSTPAAIAARITLREGVDAMATGPGVLYFRRLEARAAQSRLNKVAGMPVYQEMTIRNWRTTTRLLAMLDERAAGSPPPA